MSVKFVAAGFLAGSVILAGMIAAAAPRPDQLVDALNSVFGKHPGDSAAHTKGICLVHAGARRAVVVQGATIRQTRSHHGAVLAWRRQPASPG